ncbi:WD40/YVTN/BNR-like repeat-containing protein [Fulvivirga sedimenti]|uniref:Oxidoreductase n=1 Tax=Fulvivirga sedimenti TaxID=2879465 RepID=A0A9X1KZP7_9BACT|nr:hypothetical protein [Fulvivirga sedimenti]MCA6078530.1 hypothetical protein [Fulvivirga sedimenti]
MKKRTILLFSVCLLFGCNPEPAEDNSTPFLDAEIQNFQVNTSIRALEVIDDRHVWYAGAGGKYGVTTDGGVTWRHDSIEIEGTFPEFRAIASTSDAVFLLSVASPALLYRSDDNGQSWQLVYTESGEGVFYDAMVFMDDMNGVAMGDPVDGCISVILTGDGGQTWSKISCENLPPAEAGEGAFAASNTNIATSGSHIWIATGGGTARIYHSADKGKTWEVHQTPIIQGGTMTGIFTVDFYDENNGIIFGGDWERKTISKSNKAVTSDGGKTWELISDGIGPGYRSCIRYVPGAGGRSMIAVGIPGIAYSFDSGRHWQLISDEDFYTVRFTPSGDAAWLAGNGKIARMTLKTSGAHLTVPKNAQ